MRGAIMDLVRTKIGVIIVFYSLQLVGVDNKRISVVGATSNYTLPSWALANNDSETVEDSSLHNATAPTVAASDFPDVGFLVGCAVLVLLLLLAVVVFLWRLKRLTTAAQRGHSVHRGIILAYSNKYTESGLDDVTASEAGCVNSGFTDDKSRKTRKREDIATIAGKLGFVNDSKRSVRRSISAVSDYRSTVIRRHDKRNQYRLQPLRPKYNEEATSSDGPSTTTLSTSAPPVGFSRFFPVDSDAVFSGATEHIYDVPRETGLHRRASNPEMRHIHVYDTPDGSGTGRHVSDPLPQIGSRRLSSRSSEQTTEPYDNADENIYDVPRNCDDFDTASAQFVIDDVYEGSAETDDIYVVPSNLLIPIPICDTTVELIPSSTAQFPPNFVSTSTLSQSDEITSDTRVFIAPGKNSKPSVPPKPPRRRSKPVQPENIYAVPRKAIPTLCKPKDSTT